MHSHTHALACIYIFFLHIYICVCYLRNIYKYNMYVLIEIQKRLVKFEEIFAEWPIFLSELPG